METKPRIKASYVGAPKIFALEQACRQVFEAFGADCDFGGIYHVGSSLQRTDWRDIDLRLMMDDASFDRLFPNAGRHWEHDARWLLMTVSISEYLSRVTGLPVDFQFQPMTHANEHHKGPRSAMGIRIQD
jgi:hypothetical protein